jgi:hypothetical protein
VIAINSQEFCGGELTIDVSAPTPMSGNPEKTLHDSQNPGTLTGKKSGRKYTARNCCPSRSREFRWSNLGRFPLSVARKWGDRGISWAVGEIILADERFIGVAEVLGAIPSPWLLGIQHELTSMARACLAIGNFPLSSD